MIHTAYIGLGSNIGDREGNIHRALELACVGGKVKLKGLSKFYETTAERDGRASGDPKFINAACELETGLSARELLSHLQAVELAMGRPQKREKGAPRTIDLDILLFDEDIINEQNLAVPHPRLDRRRFVLRPLCDIAPHRLHPVRGKKFTELLKELKC